MRHSLLILACLLFVTWFEFQVYPGHTYLQRETQLLVPMLERLDTPGFLSRDLVAANPIFAYTIYDEIAQFLHATARLTFEQALVYQQLVFRFSAVIGIFLLARALKVAPLAAVLISASVNAITHLSAPDAFVTSQEPTPAGFALSLILLAAGFLVYHRPLLASLAAGFALLYDPGIAAPFWLLVLIASISDRAMRRFLRPSFPVLIIFALILGNLAQLQPGLGSGLDITSNVSASTLRLTQIRTPSTWVASWFISEIWSYTFLIIAGIWALASISNFSNRLLNWTLLGLPISGLACVGAVMIPGASHLQLATSMPPARNLALTVAISIALCGAASYHAAHRGKWLESAPWAALLFGAILNAQVLDLLHLRLAGVPSPGQPTACIRALADWAEKSTWGSSMFQFPDLDKGNDPGVFRALSRRSLYADWNSGAIADYSDQAGQEWWTRWQSIMTGRYSTVRLESMLPLPIDYYVLHRTHELTNIKPAYKNSEYVVYDAQDLREARQPISSKPLN